jgi:hypothetical protein
MRKTYILGLLIYYTKLGAQGTKEVDAPFGPIGFGTHKGIPEPSLVSMFCLVFTFLIFV